MSDLKELRAQAFELSGGRCCWPTCPFPAEELAHIEHRGMGSFKAVNRLELFAPCCKWHHDILDGRTVKGRRREVGLLLKAWLACQRSYVDMERTKE